jgi:ribosomal-protein-alanine N-acetyltransferase
VALIRARMRIYLEDANAEREDEVLRAMRQSSKLHAPWLASPPKTPARFERFIRGAHSETRRTFYVLNEERAFVGVITIAEIVRGLFKSAYLSYFAVAPYAGRGYMSAGLEAVVRRAFGEMRLHRLEANIQPKNLRSKALVQRCGFELEGYSKRYLKIGGRWRDHERWAITKESFQARKRSKKRR